ncbi:hypothetical protein V6N13_114242 [Hibiscus sabdariffa]
MANTARYAMVAARSKWEELARQPGRANYNWVLEFYANNADGEDFSMVRGRRVPATAATINALLGLPNDDPSIYAILGGFEEEDFEVIKDFLSQPNTEWSTTGRNTNSVSRPNLLPEAKLWNTSEEAVPPLHILQLRNQLQRIEARQIQFQEEIKVFQSNLLKFLQFQFPASAAFFGPPSTAPPQPSVSAAAAAQPSTHTSAKEGATEEVHFSSNDENDIFDWQSPRDHLLTIGPVTATPAPAVPILSAAPTPTTSAVAERPTPELPTRKRGKATAGRTIGSNNSFSPEEEADQRPPSEEGSTMSSLLIVMRMTAASKYQSLDLNNQLTLPFLLLFKIYLSAHSSLSHVFLPCIEDNASLEFGGAFV